MKYRTIFKYNIPDIIIADGDEFTMSEPEEKVKVWDKCSSATIGTHLHEAMRLYDFTGLRRPLKSRNVNVNHK
jgi:hypothetical protein